MSINFSRLSIKPFLTENMQNRIQNIKKDELMSVCTYFNNNKDAHKQFFDFLEYGSKYKHHSSKIIKFLIGEYSEDRLRDLDYKIPTSILDTTKKDFVNAGLSKVLSKILKAGNTIHDSNDKASEKLKLLKLLFLYPNSKENQEKINETIDNINMFHYTELTGIRNMLNRVNETSSEEFSNLANFWKKNNITDNDKAEFIKLFTKDKPAISYLDFIKFLIGEYSIDKVKNKLDIPNSLLDGKLLKSNLSNIFSKLLKTGKTVYDYEEKAKRKLMLLSYILTTDGGVKKDIIKYFDNIGFDNKIIFSQEKCIGIQYKWKGNSYNYLGQLKNAIPNDSKGNIVNENNTYSAEGTFKNGILTMGSKTYKEEKSSETVEERYEGFFQDNGMLEGALSIKALNKDNKEFSKDLLSFNGKFKNSYPYKGKFTRSNYTFEGTLIRRDEGQVLFFEGYGEQQYTNGNINGNMVRGRVLNLIQSTEPKNLKILDNNVVCSQQSVMYFITKDDKKFLKVNNSKLYLKTVNDYCLFTGLLDENGELCEDCILEFKSKIIKAKFKAGKVVNDVAEIAYTNSPVKYKGKVNDTFIPCGQGSYVINKNGDTINGETSVDRKNIYNGKYIIKNNTLIKEVKATFDYQKILSSVNNKQDVDYYDLLINNTDVKIEFNDRGVFEGKCDDSTSSNGIKLIKGQMFLKDGSGVYFGKFNYLSGAREGECEVLLNIRRYYKEEMISKEAPCVLIKSGNFKNDFFTGENISRLFYRSKNKFKEYTFDGTSGGIHFDANNSSITETGPFKKYTQYVGKITEDEIEKFYNNRVLKSNIKTFLKDILKVNEPAPNSNISRRL